MSNISISQAAKILGVSTKTLLRADKDGLFPAEREEISKTRFYDQATVEKLAQWLDLRKRHKDHLNKLGPIHDALDKFIPKKPLEPFQNPEVYDGKELKKAVDAMQEWEDIEAKITGEYATFSGFFYRLEKNK